MSDILFDVEGGVGYITLNRPKARNALTTGMVREVTAHLDAWESDPSIHAALVHGAGEYGLCAGGDVRLMHAGALAGDDSTAEFFHDEYRMNARIHQFTKPYVSIMDGLVMGGGVGVSAHGSHRIVTERSILAMPEVTIGICPDVGATWILAHTPGELGTYLAMTGTSFGPADAIYLGFADALVPVADLAVLERRIQDDAIDQVIDELSQPAGESPLAAQQEWIDACFAGNSVDDILGALDNHTDPRARETAALIRTKSPIAVTVTLEALRRTRRMTSLEEALESEFSVSCYLMYGHDGIEGVRALIIDKDKNPQWSPRRFEDVTASERDDAFPPSRFGNLGLL